MRVRRDLTSGRRGQPSSSSGTTPSSAAGGQRREHLAHAAAEDRMHPVRRDVGERAQHEAALVQPRMRQHQPRRRRVGLRGRVERHPARDARARSGSTRSSQASRSRSQARGAQRRRRSRPSARSTACSAASSAAGASSVVERRGAVDEIRARRPAGRPACGTTRLRAATRDAARRQRRERGLERRARRARPATAGSRRARSARSLACIAASRCELRLSVARAGPISDAGPRQSSPRGPISSSHFDGGLVDVLS